MDLARADIEVHIVVGDDAGESLDDAGRRQGGSAGVRDGVGLAGRWRGRSSDQSRAKGGEGPRPGVAAFRTGSAQESGGNSVVMPSFHQYMHVVHSEPGAPGGNWSRSDCSSLLPAGSSSLPVLSTIGLSNTSLRIEIAGEHLREQVLDSRDVRLGQVRDALGRRLAVHEPCTGPSPSRRHRSTRSPPRRSRP